MGTSQSQSTNPKAESILSALALAAYVLGPQAISTLPAAQKSKYGGFLDQIMGGSAGNLPGTIFPNYQNLLQESQRSFFNQLPQSATAFTPPPTGIGGGSPLQTLFGSNPALASWRT